MNNVTLLGRLSKEPDVRKTQNGTSVCQFVVAVDRRFKQEGGPTADFINCVAWKGTADFIGKYFGKGSRIAVVGSIQTRSYEDKDGKRVYVTEVVADSVYFCESKNSSSNSAQNDVPPPTEDDAPAESEYDEVRMTDVETEDDDIPF